MRLSKLQKYILDRCFYAKKGILGKKELLGFYLLKDLEERGKKIVDTIHKSIEALVKKDLLIAFGHKTAKKWFVHKRKSTRKGKKIRKERRGNRQVKVPIK